jgi:uncharacterized protein
VAKGERYLIVRFISWAASHDLRLTGMKEDSALGFIRELEKYGRVFISSEKPLNAALSEYRLHLPPEAMHSVLSSADLYIGEGGTMAVEAAILGTPSIHIEGNAQGVATGTFSGNFRELRDRYELLYFFPTQEEALEKARDILGSPDSKQVWAGRRERLLREKIDVTSWMFDFVRRYPESLQEARKVGIR